MLSLPSTSNDRDERIAGIEEQRALRHDERRTGDRRKDGPVPPRNRPLEHASQDAFLAPHLAFAEPSVLRQTGHLGAGARAAGGTIIRLPGAQREAPAVHARGFRGADELDVVDLLSAGPGHPLTGKRRADAPGDLGQLVDPAELQPPHRTFGNEEPVSAPGDVPGDPADAVNLD